MNIVILYATLAKLHYLIIFCLRNALFRYGYVMYRFMQSIFFRVHQWPITKHLSYIISFHGYHKVSHKYTATRPKCIQNLYEILQSSSGRTTRGKELPDPKGAARPTGAARP